MDNKKISKLYAKRFVQKVIETILFQRKIITTHKVHDPTFKGYGVLERLIKRNMIEITKAINEENVEKISIHIINKYTNTVIEKYLLRFFRYTDDSLTKDDIDIDNLLRHMTYSIKKYFHSLPPVSHLDVNIHMKLCDDETDALFSMDNTGSYSLGTFHTLYYHIKVRMQGNIKFQDCRDPRESPQILEWEEEMRSKANIITL